MIRSSLSLHRPLSFYLDLAEHQDYFEWETVDELPALIHLKPATIRRRLRQMDRPQPRSSRAASCCWREPRRSGA
jgi:hypothetical protein